MSCYVMLWFISVRNGPKVTTNVSFESWAITCMETFDLDVIYLNSVQVQCCLIMQLNVSHPNLIWICRFEHIPPLISYSISACLLATESSTGLTKKWNCLKQSLCSFLHLYHRHSTTINPLTQPSAHVLTNISNYSTKKYWQMKMPWAHSQSTETCCM